MNTKNYQDYVEEINLERYWLVIKRRWLPMIIVFGLCLSGSLAFVLLKSTQSSIYRATGKLLLQADRSTSLTEVGKDIGSLKPLGRSNPLDNQAIILQSSSVLEQAIVKVPEDYKKYDQEFFSSLDEFREYLTIESEKETDVLVVKYDTLDPNLSALIVNEIMNAYVNYNITLNRLEASAARKFVEAQIPEAKAKMDQAADDLRLFQIRNQIVDLTNESQAAVNEVTTLNSQINDLQGRLAEATSRLNALQKQLDIPLNQARQLDTVANSSSVQGLVEELLSVQTDLANQQSLYTNNFPTIVNLREKEASLQALIKKKSQEALEQNQVVNSSGGSLSNNPQISELNRQLMTQLIEAQVNRLSLMSQLKTLEERRQDYFARSRNFPYLEKQQRELQLQLKIAENNYAKLLERRQEAILAENQVVSSAEIIEKAQVPKLPIESSSNRNKYALAAMIGSLFLAVTSAFFLDLIDTSVKTPEEGEALFGHPIIGLIPLSKFPLYQQILAQSSPDKKENLSNLIQWDLKGAALVTAYQKLYFNINLMSLSHQGLGIAIGVTSSVAKENASEVCASLALTMAQAGKRTLLIDTNLRNPIEDRQWNVDNQIGLTDVLLAKKELSEVLQKIDQDLTLLTTGMSISNPSAMIDSTAMKNLIATLKKQYDYIIFDTPSLAETTDSVMLGKFLDGMLLVVKPQQLSRTDAQSAKFLLERSAVNMIGIVGMQV